MFGLLVISWGRVLIGRAPLEGVNPASRKNKSPRLGCGVLASVARKLNCAFPLGADGGSSFEGKARKVNCAFPLVGGGGSSLEGKAWKMNCPFPLAAGVELELLPVTDAGSVALLAGGCETFPLEAPAAGSVCGDGDVV